MILAIGSPATVNILYPLSRLSGIMATPIGGRQRSRCEAYPGLPKALILPVYTRLHGGQTPGLNLVMINPDNHF